AKALHGSDADFGIDLVGAAIAVRRLRYRERWDDRARSKLKPRFRAIVERLHGALHARSERGLPSCVLVADLGRWRSSGTRQRDARRAGRAVIQDVNVPVELFGEERPEPRVHPPEIVVAGDSLAIDESPVADERHEPVHESRLVARREVHADAVESPSELVPARLADDESLPVV